MSETISQLLATFSALPPDQQHTLLIEMLKRTGELPPTALTDDQLTAMADDLFQRLDGEELDDRKAGAG